MYKWILCLLFLTVFLILPSKINAQELLVSQDQANFGTGTNSAPFTRLQTLGSGFSTNLHSIKLTLVTHTTLPAGTDVRFYNITDNTYIESTSFSYFEYVESGSNRTDVTVDFSASELTLNPTKSYGFMISLNSGTLPSFRYQTTSNPYTNGTHYSSSSFHGCPTFSGCTSVGSDLTDLRFFIYGYTPVPEATLDAETIDIVNQQVVLDLSGDLLVTGVGYSATVYVKMSCSKSGFANYDSVSSEAKIRLYASSPNDGPTIDYGNGEYTGYGYTPTLSTWVAKSIRVPYKAGWDCVYPLSYVVLDDTRDIVAEGDIDTIEPTNTTVSTSDPLTEPEPTDPIAWLAWKIKQVFIEIFGFRTQSFEKLAELRETVISKAPFAYVYAAFDVSTTNPATSSAIPSINVPFIAHDDHSVIPASLTWGGQSFIQSFLNGIRTFLSIALWLLFFVYAFLLGRRLL